MTPLNLEIAKARELARQASRGLFIGGQWRPAVRDRQFEVEDPATGEPIAAASDATVEDGLSALAAAVDAQTEWAATPPRERGELLTRAFEILQTRRDDFARLMTIEMGKAFSESQAEVAYAAEFLRWFGEEAVRINGGYLPSPQGGSRMIVMRQPVGPGLLITPWNFPLAMGTRKIGPALAAGCTVVIKPARQTPLSMLALAAAFDEAGVPPGVLNVVTTSDSGAVTAALIKSSHLRKLSFTGSTGVGALLLEQSAPRVLRTSMELGGNAPFIVFSDADLDVAVEAAVQAKMRNGGEACTAANRFYVQRPLADDFAAKLAGRLGELRMGHGLDPNTQLGPLIDNRAATAMGALVGNAIDHGAKLLVGGERRDGPGHFFEATVLTEVPPQARILREEIFGPVAPIVAFDDEEEVLQAANSTEFGLAAYVMTQNLDRGLRVAERLEAGMVGLNAGVISNPAAPFGGVKLSGLGREGGFTGIDEYLETKYVAVSAPW